MKIKIKFLSFLLLIGSILIFGHCKKNDLKPPAIDTLAFTAAEKAVIFNNNRDSSMYVMNYFIHADSLVLRKHSRKVNLNDTTTLFYLINRMKKTVITENGVGIAAPQVGINRDIIWVQRFDKGSLTSHPWEVYLNPVITKYSDTTKLRNDGCLSLPGVSGQSWRAIWVDVEYDLPDGTHFAERINTAYTAHIFQHEIDHLNGIVFIDRMTQ